MQFASLGSGSRGNAALVKSEHALIMVDCGFTIKETVRRLAELGHQPQELTALLVTHEHGDHIKGVGPLARKYQLPVYLTHGTGQYHGVSKLTTLNQVNAHRGFQLADIDIMPVAVPHDAREPCQYVFRSNNKTLGLLTDLGSITSFVVDQYRHCDGLMLECNHDSRMLSMGPYPPSVKLRVGGQWGHLNNLQASSLLQQVDMERLQHLVISHISEQNNTTQLARSAIVDVYGDRPSLMLADQDRGIGWLQLE